MYKRTVEGNLTIDAAVVDYIKTLRDLKIIVLIIIVAYISNQSRKCVCVCYNLVII